MRLYEGMFLLDSNLATKDWPGLEAHIQDILKKNRAEILYSERWPDRKLAYTVKGCKKGTYYLTYFNAPPEGIRDIERDSKLSERILRVLIIQEKGLEREMERRKNREVTAPPAEISFEDERFESREHAGPARRRGDFPTEAVAALKEETSQEPPEYSSEESDGSDKGEEDSKIDDVK